MKTIITPTEFAERVAATGVDNVAQRDQAIEKWVNAAFDKLKIELEQHLVDEALVTVSAYPALALNALNRMLEPYGWLVQTAPSSYAGSIWLQLEAIEVGK